jgi:putative aldouronate transport system substrate-binding protein
MRKRFKQLTLALAILLIFTLSLSACGGGGGSGSETTQEEGNKQDTGKSAGQEEDATPELKPYEISLYYPGSPQPDQQLVEAEMNKHLKEKINASIKLMPIDWGAWTDKINLMIASGEEADIIFTAGWFGYSTNVAKGAYLELNDLITEYGKDITANLDPAFLAGSKVNGKNYGVPTNKELAASRGVLLRKDLVEKYNMDISTIKTVADLEPFLQIIKDKEPEMVPFYMSQTENVTNMIMQWDSLGDTVIPGVIRKDGTDTTVVNEYEQPETLERIALARDWYKKGYINKDAATTTVQPGEQAKSGNVFILATSLKPGKDAEMTNSTKYPYIQVELTEPTISTHDTTGSMLAISRTSKDPARAMMLINLLHSDKYLNNMLNFGIEGTHYVKVSDEVIKLPDGVKPEENKYNPGSAWMFGNQFLNYLFPNEDPEKWAKFREFNDRGISSPALGFTFNAEPVKSEIAAVDNVNKQYVGALYTGTVDAERYLQEFIQKQKDAGLDKIITEKQKQLDEYLANK